MKKTRMQTRKAVDPTGVDSSFSLRKGVNKRRVKIWRQPTLSFGSSAPIIIKTEPQKVLLSITRETSLQIEGTDTPQLGTQDMFKQEGNIAKLKIVEQDTYTDTVNMRDTGDIYSTIQIKKETNPLYMQDELKLSELPCVPDLMPDPEDLNLYCRVCKVTRKNKRAFRAHCTGVHKMKLPLTPKVLQKTLIAKFPDILPDPDDPDFNCCVCQKNYSDKYNYRRHLRKCHKMTLEPLGPTNVINPYIIPDENDPNDYCAACEKSFSSKWGYQSHLETIHNLTLKGGQRTKKTDGPLPDEDDPNGHCSQCNKTLDSLRSYRNHLRKIHGMVLKPKGRALRALNADLIPDENDPNNYCLVCKRQYGVKRGYRVHLETMHNMVLKSEKPQRAEIITVESKVIPNPNDPNLFCCLCKKAYDTRLKYRHHLRKCHKMVLTPMGRRSGVDSPMPDIDNPDNFCLSCDRQYSNSAHYRKHVSRVHKKPHIGITKPLETVRCPTCEREILRKTYGEQHTCQEKDPKLLSKASNVIEDVSNVKPDKDDPNFYCSVCKKNSPDKRTFNNHLKIVHKLNTRNETCSPPPMLKPLPDVYHPEFYCNLCKRNLSNVGNFHRHLRAKHKMKFKIPRKTHDVISHPELEPDEFDPDLKCSACVKKFSCVSGFRSHLRKIHKMTLSTFRKPRRRTRRIKKEPVV